VNDNLTVTAAFTTPSATKKLTVTVVGSGTVTSEPAGINQCSSSSTCPFDFPANTSVKLTASPSSPSTFAGWSGGPCSGPTLVCIVSMTGDQNLTATFNSPTGQTISVTTPDQPTAIFDSTFTVAATANSNLPVTIAVDGVCTISSGGSGSAIIKMTSGIGTCTVHYNQPGNASFSAAPEITKPTTAQKKDQTITITTPAPSVVDNNQSFNVAASSDSGLPVAITASDDCGGSGSGSAPITVTIAQGSDGTCTVHYNQVGNDNYKSATEKTESPQVRP
jgi:hypothetical protein